MKKLVIGLLGVAAATTAMADININWFGSAGFYQNGTAPVDPNDYILFGGGVATAQLIWSPDTTVGALDIANVAGKYVSGNDVWLDAFTISSAPYGDFSNGAEIYAGALGGGYVFVRVFDTAAPVGGQGYFDSTPTAAPTYNPAAPVVTFVDANATTPAGAELNKIIAVPEPATFAFLGIGGILAAVRRMRRS